MLSVHARVYSRDRDDLRDLLPDTLDVADFCLTTKLTLGTDLSGNFLHLSGENGQLVDHAVDGVDEIEYLSRDWYARDLLRQIALRHGALQWRSLIKLCF